MKKINIVYALAGSVILGSCSGPGSSSSSVSEPVETENGTTMTQGDATIFFDPDTELQTSANALTIGKIYIIDGDDKRLSNSDIALNSTFSVVYEGIKNFTLKDGKAFPDLSINVVDNDQQTVVSETDLLASYVDGLSEQDASVLRATVTVGDPMKPGKYICSIQVVDKNNSEAAILSTWSFEVK